MAGGDDGTYQTNTYFTTYTYYNTLLAGNKPFVITSKQTLENIVTVPIPQAGNFIERTEVSKDALKTLEFKGVDSFIARDQYS